jgi:hypothetical protein
MQRRGAMGEKQLETDLCRKLVAGLTDRTNLNEVSLCRSTSDCKTLRDLIGDAPCDLIEDSSIWQLHPKFMVDIIGGMTPDIVLRSSLSGENRIYIEVKNTAEIGYGKAESQVIRYFLHLLATSHKTPPGVSSDIHRALILAAPSSWFAAEKNASTWGYFLDK